jgi:hypothetical protein
MAHTLVDQVAQTESRGQESYAAGVERGAPSLPSMPREVSSRLGGA